MIRPDITKYTDYRNYVKDMFLFYKKENKNFSYLYCAKRLKTSKNYIKLIMDKNRDITIDKISLFCDLFNLDQLESQYFFFLFIYSTIDDAKIKGYSDIVLKKLKFDKIYNSKISFENSDIESESIYHNWLQLILHSMVNLPMFDESPEWIKRRIIENYSTNEMGAALF